jgi:hypothetical protein
VSEFRIEKRRAEATLTLATGTSVRGCFFLSGSAAGHLGPERVADLLNAETGFFPFELNAGCAPYTVLYNRTQLVLVRLLDETVEAQMDPGYSDRLSDYARAPEIFRYVETEDGTVIVNAAHIVELRETTEA